jgi:hypothetical protein
LLQDEQDGQYIDSSLLRQLQLLRSARLLRLALICQDLADSMTAINDITGEPSATRSRPARVPALHLRKEQQHDAGVAAAQCNTWHDLVQASACTAMQCSC